MTISVWRGRIRDSFWFLPAVYNLAALVVAAASVTLDLTMTRTSLLGGVFRVPIDLAIDVLSTLAVAILTMTAITFSTMMVVLSTYSTQFSPRVLQNFIADRSTQHVLAIFSSGFTYSLTTLLFMNKAYAADVSVSPLLGVLWGLVGIGAFVYFIHHATVWMRVNNLIGAIAEETESTIERVTTRRIRQQRSRLRSEDRGELRRRTGTPVPAPSSGYIVLIRMERLFELARNHDAVVDMEVRIGAYVMEGTSVMTVYPGRDEPVQPREYADCVELDDEQKDWQDIGFGLRKLVEIALRAISPSINDPYTAATCVNRMTPMLAMLANRDQRVSAFYDKDDVLRLIAVDYRFEDYLFKAYHEIRDYGVSDVTVIAAIIESLTLVAKSAGWEYQDTLWQFGLETAAAFDAAGPLEASRQRVRQALGDLAAATGHEEELRSSDLLSEQSPTESG